MSTREVPARHEPRTQEIPVPKSDGKDVAKYLGLFEDVMRQNQYEDDTWALRLRAHAVGTVLQDATESGGTYQELKAEILATHGKTAETAWRELISSKQSSETFRRYCLTVKRRVELAQGDGSTTEDTLVKYIVRWKTSRQTGVRSWSNANRKN